MKNNLWILWTTLLSFFLQTHGYCEMQTMICPLAKKSAEKLTSKNSPITYEAQVSYDKVDSDPIKSRFATVYIMKRNLATGRSEAIKKVSLNNGELKVTKRINPNKFSRTKSAIFNLNLKDGPGGIPSDYNCMVKESSPL